MGRTTTLTHSTTQGCESQYCKTFLLNFNIMSALSVKILGLGCKFWRIL